jgi:1-acyl-sn-glycerol-3-phosphate acyltransferase
MEKEDHAHGYRFFRDVLGVIFKIYYRPKYYNKDVIPKEGPIIVCGNHVHLYDQNLACTSTKRMLHYMAKKEYFDNKKTKWFFESVGCIPVNRQIHDDGSKDRAILLLNEGKAIGIYPEGTRNSLVCKDDKFKVIYEFVKDKISFKDYKKKSKKEMVLVSQTDLLLKLYNDKKITLDAFKESLFDVDNSLLNLVDKKVITEEQYNDNLLLPLKFGVVSMAQKTNATIIPYAITGKYRIRNNHLNICFGEPFNVPIEMDLEEANKKLRKAIIDLKVNGIKEIKEGKR